VAAIRLLLFISGLTSALSALEIAPKLKIILGARNIVAAPAL
jgi:hypothetical protein